MIIPNCASRQRQTIVLHIGIETKFVNLYSTPKFRSALQMDCLQLRERSIFTKPRV